MSNTTNMVVPAHIANRIAARQQSGTPQSSVMDSVLTGGKFPYPKISIRAGRYRLVEEGGEVVVGTTMPVVLIGANPNVSKIYYGKPYDPDATDARPDCFSNDGLKPDPSVQNPVSSSCVSCSHNVLGSKITPSGKKSKLCADQRHLAVVPAADPTKLYALSIPVSAMKGLRLYLQDLKNYGLKVEEVVTQLGFDDTTSFPKIVFSRSGFLPEDSIAAVERLQVEQVEQIKEITREKPLSGATAAALAAPAAAVAALPAAAPIAEEEAEDDDIPAEAASVAEAKLDTLFDD